MLRRFFRRSKSEAAGEGGGVADVDCEASFARAALDAWAADLRAGSTGSEALEPETPSGSAKKSHLARAVHSIVALPKGEERNALVERLAALVRRAGFVLPEGGEQPAAVERPLALLREGFRSKELADALVEVLAALLRDGPLDRAEEAAASCEAARLQVAAAAAGDAARAAAAGGAAAGSEAGRAVELAAVLSKAAALGEAAARCEELRETRRNNLRQAEGPLAVPRSEAEARCQEALAERRLLEERLVTLGREAGAELVGSSTLEQESLRLEEEVLSLQDRKKELKAELDVLSRKHDDAVARQKAHLTQVDSWRMDKEKVKESVGRSMDWVQSEQDAIAREQASCSSLLQGVLAVREALQQAVDRSDAEVVAAAQHTEESLAAAAALTVSTTEARLTAALAVARKVFAEHRRAKATLELLEVQAPTTELPTRSELVAALGSLRDAWAARVTLGCVALARRGDVESFLREASEEDASHETSAEAKAAWAERWGELGDLAATLADAAAGAGGGLQGSSSASFAQAPSPSRGPSAGAEAPPRQALLPSLDDGDEEMLSP